MMDYRGYIAEATGANIFLVIDGKIHTPTPDCFLDGITRRTVIALARTRGMEVIERHIQPDELDKANEVFLCGTAVEVTPVREIGDRTFTPGEITRTLMEDYDEEVRREVPKTLNAPKANAA
jgi:branched-chain amino acid aminotransferase